MKPQSLHSDIVNHVLRRVPKPVTDIMHSSTPVFLAGGCIRAVLNCEVINDFDLFTETAGDAEHIAKKLDPNAIKTKNAWTLKKFNPTVQVVTREFYSTPEALIENFDFTICQAVIYWDHDMWRGLCSEDFQSDMEARVLRYCKPGNNCASESLIRAFKFAERGYLPTPSCLAALVTVAYEENHQDGADVVEKQLRNIFSGNGGDWNARMRSSGY